MSDSLRPYESQHARPPCPSPTPGVHWDSRPSSQWCHPAISSSVVPFSSCPQSLPASESFSMSQLFAWGGQTRLIHISMDILATLLFSTRRFLWELSCIEEKTFLPSSLSIFYQWHFFQILQKTFYCFSFVAIIPLNLWLCPDIQPFWLSSKETLLGLHISLESSRASPELLPWCILKSGLDP